MADRIFIGVAWPYANGPLHLGHIAGAYLPADIFARYHRMKGNEVLIVSGSDTHGAPITLQADKEGVSPRELFERYHKLFLQVWQQFGISFDLYTHTDTENHHRISQTIFLRLRERGYLLVQKAVANVFGGIAAIFARPLCHWHLPPLRLRASTRRPMRKNVARC
jgi:methionyl-tRNA synthetase (EC 6.1.1.10)